jgi:hypothetical protein
LAAVALFLFTALPGLVDRRRNGDDDEGGRGSEEPAAAGASGNGSGNGSGKGKTGELYETYKVEGSE